MSSLILSVQGSLVPSVVLCNVTVMVMPFTTVENGITIPGTVVTCTLILHVTILFNEVGVKGG